MKTVLASFRTIFLGAVSVGVVLLGGAPAAARVLDDFNDNTKTGWTDFTFVPGFGLPTEADQQFKFALPPVGRAIFTASQKTTETFELKEGRTLEFRVDIVSAGSKDSFAVLAFIPTANSPGTLAGYGFAKSTTDVLLTKGINRYFVNEATALKQDNTTLVLTLTVRGGNVIVTGKVLDKDDRNAVIWQKAVIDTPAADVMADGDDSPAPPFITTGYFTLICYADYDRNAPENPYFANYDNAEVWVTDRAVLDDFDDNAKSGWTDFTFVPGFGLPKEENQQFRFALPPAGRAIFTASQKTTQVFELKEGERLQFGVDIVESGGKDSFAVLAFIPTANSPGTLAGYGFAKSTTDILLTKGINRYFVNEAIDLKQNNISLALTLTVRHGNVEIHGQALDKDANNAVFWERTFVDTPAADVMADGEDSPAAPFITSGYFTLICYADYDRNAPENPYFVYFDNAVVAAPPVAANTAPLISEVQPIEFGNFLPASTVVSFKVDDDKPLSNDRLSITLNGVAYTVANGLTVGGSGASRTVSLGGLQPNVNYVAILSAEDSDGATTSRALYFDTFAPDSLVIEVEDYNFDNGRFIDNPTPAPEGSGPAATAYSLQTGTPNVDYLDTRPAPHATLSVYRPDDTVRMQHSLDHGRAKFAAAGGTEAGVYDYDVGDIAGGEWLNYTRTFPAGSYEVYLRQALANMDTGESVLELITSDPSQPNQTTRLLGSFLGAKTGFQYRNFLLTDATGQRAIVRLAGIATLRLRQVTADAPDGARYQNYLIFNPVPDPGLQRAVVASTSPAAGATVTGVQPVITVKIQNRDTSVKADTIKLEINGQVVPASIVPTAEGAELTYPIWPLPPSGANNTARVSFKDNFEVEVSNQWDFVLSYLSLDPANRRPGPGNQSGFKARFVQATADAQPLANDLQRAEDQLAANSTIPKAVDVTEQVQVVNLAQDERVSGFFDGEQLVPGLDEAQFGTDDFAVEINTWLELPAGPVRFRIVTDDGYKLSSGRSPNDKEPVLGFHNGGPANETVEFIVPAAGLYPFRLVWYERGGNAYAEWSAEDLADPAKRTLINDPNTPGAIKAFTQVPPPTPAVTLLAASVVTGPYDPDPSATVNTNTKTVTVPRTSEVRFYRLRAGSALRFKSIRLEAANVVMTYE